MNAVGTLGRGSSYHLSNTASPSSQYSPINERLMQETGMRNQMQPIAMTNQAPNSQTMQRGIIFDK